MLGTLFGLPLEWLLAGLVLVAVAVVVVASETATWFELALELLD